jgi:hypothetical protein
MNKLFKTMLYLPLIIAQSYSMETMPTTPETSERPLPAWFLALRKHCPPAPEPEQSVLDYMNLEDGTLSGNFNGYIPMVGFQSRDDIKAIDLPLCKKVRGVRFNSAGDCAAFLCLVSKLSMVLRSLITLV